MAIDGQLQRIESSDDDVSPRESEGRAARPLAILTPRAGSDDAADALQCAIGLRNKSGLPVVDLTGREPPQVAA